MGTFSARRIIGAFAVSTAAVALFAAPGVASAATQCSGSNIIAAGSTLQKLAQKEVWEPEFKNPPNKNKAACSAKQGTGGKPTVSYESIGSGAGLEKWGVNGHAFEAGSFAVVATDEPINTAQKAEIESHETGAPESVQTIPVIQAAVALIVNLPTGCTSAESTLAKGRLVLNNTTLESIWRGTITKWS